MVVDGSEPFTKSDAHPSRPSKLIGSGCIESCVSWSQPLDFPAHKGNKSNSDWWNETMVNIVL